ncbi:hypothetical protein AC579_1265 [Pseudocercospora musae]|uniref:Uncharacterized protein n=1 Tax=Pseudocercospora musae TaxID=113226 RepID=A0A139HFD4_9PEZI|nr:hypothetical protein AC579_1265 [Pseudocercospora musae]
MAEEEWHSALGQARLSYQEATQSDAASLRIFFPIFVGLVCESVKTQKKSSLARSRYVINVILLILVESKGFSVLVKHADDFSTTNGLESQLLHMRLFAGRAIGKLHSGILWMKGEQEDGIVRPKALPLPTQTWLQPTHIENYFDLDLGKHSLAHPWRHGLDDCRLCYGNGHARKAVKSRLTTPASRLDFVDSILDVLADAVEGFLAVEDERSPQEVTDAQILQVELRDGQWLTRSMLFGAHHAFVVKHILGRQYSERSHFFCVVQPFRDHRNK